MQVAVTLLAVQVTAVPSHAQPNGELVGPAPPTCEVHALFTLSANAQVVPGPAYVADAEQ